MEKIKILCKEIREELKDAETYAERSIKSKGEGDKDLAEMYVSLANAEMEHVEKLHNAAVREIDRIKSSGKEVPPVMMELWKWQHSELAEEAAEVKMLISIAAK